MVDLTEEGESIGPLSFGGSRVESFEEQLGEYRRKQEQRNLPSDSLELPVEQPTELPKGDAGLRTASTAAASFTMAASGLVRDAGAAPGEAGSPTQSLPLLDAQQAAAVALCVAQENVFICGGGGVGKSGTVVRSIADSDFTHAVMGPHHSSLKIIKAKCLKNLQPDVFARQRFMTVNKGSGVNVGDDWDTEEIRANFENEGRSGLRDSATADRSIVDEVGQLDPNNFSTMRQTIEAVRGREMKWTLSGDLQTRPIKSDGSSEMTWFFESPSFSSDFVIVPLCRSYRSTDPRAVRAFKDIKIRRDSEDVRHFFRTAEQVCIEFAPGLLCCALSVVLLIADCCYRCIAQVDLAQHARDVLHLFWSNEEAEHYARKDLTKTHGLLNLRIVNAEPDQAKYSYDQRRAFASKFVWDLVLVEGEEYLFSSNEGEIIEVDGIPLRNKDVLRCTNRDLGDGRAQFLVVDREVKTLVILSQLPRTANFNYVELRASAFSLKYARFGPVFSRQGAEWDYVWVHAEKIKGPNVLYTAVTRCKGSPFDGKLQISGLNYAKTQPVIRPDGSKDWSASHVTGQEAMKLKWQACPKMIVFQHFVFRDVPNDIFQKALTEITDTAHWRAVMQKLSTMRVVRQGAD